MTIDPGDDPNPDPNSDPIAIVMPVLAELDRLQVPYHLCGSIVSIILGEPRQTNDIDLVADLRSDQVAEFTAALGPGYYVDEAAICMAIATRTSFNLLHLGTAFKIDVFLPKRTPYQAEEMRRRRTEVLDAEGLRRVTIATAEDTILSKLVWFVSGGRVSDRQWRDVLGVIKLQAKKLDLPYLRRWAEDLHVQDLLEQALGESGVG